jgi:hypothetical protein
VKNSSQFETKLYRMIATMFALLILLAAPAAIGQTARFAQVHDFNGMDGNYPIGTLIMDASGNFYGVTHWGADDNYSCGSVFKLTPTSGGTAWRVTVLHKFSGAQSDCNPWAGLVIDGNGNLYGTADETLGFGAVYELSPTSGGAWSYSVIYQFMGGTDGSVPTGKLILDAAGNLYGTTSIGDNAGSVFELSPSTSGEWNETVLYNFSGPGGSDGANPAAGLIFDAAGNLYGTTQNGGNTTGICATTSGCGVVFKLAPNGSGGWTEFVIHTFSGLDGAFPQADLTMDASGNLYSMTYAGGNINACHIGPSGCGVAFELSHNNSGGWTYHQLNVFQPGSAGSRGGAGGAYPYAGLTFDSAGNLWGTTTLGGLAPYYAGVVFKLSPNATGPWTETIVHAFDMISGGFGANSSITFNAAGKAFGTTAAGGALNRCTFYGAGGGCGLVFGITP